ncbi:MAG: anthranilate synthase component I family protein [Porticoccaceae bacterium]
MSESKLTLPQIRFMTDIQDFPYSTNTSALFETIRHLPNPVWLDSGKPRSLQGRFDIISAAPLQVLESRGGVTRTSGSNIASSRSQENPFVLAQRLLDEMSAQQYSEVSGDHSPALPFTGGLIGSFGYQAGNNFSATDTALDKGLTDIVDFPDMRLGFYAWALVINHQIRQAWLVFHPACPAALKAEIEALSSAAATAQQKAGSDKTSNDSSKLAGFHLTKDFTPSTDKAAYLDAVARIQSYIAAGDCYQANYAQHFSASYAGEPWLAYQHLRDVLPSPFSAYLEWDGLESNGLESNGLENKRLEKNKLKENRHAVLCLSPERFLKVANGSVETKPIKGTIRRGKTVTEDEEAAITLLNSSKDRAENLMIVDLLRNDLGKACRPGSIRVPKLFGLESFANVHHLVSTITGQLREQESALSLLEHCFPGGSITGAPKKRAMEVITELETLNRSLYCGSIGYVSTNGRMDTNIVIRTLLADGERLHCWGGGGIVADSDPETEYQESIAKVAILLKALNFS